MPESLARAQRRKKQEWSRFCMSSPSVTSTREFGAGLRKDFAQHGEVEAQRLAQSPIPSARPAVLMFITMLTSA
jgi:hypothetical protein